MSLLDGIPLVLLAEHLGLLDPGPFPVVSPILPSVEMDFFTGECINCDGTEYADHWLREEMEFLLQAGIL